MMFVLEVSTNLPRRFRVRVAFADVPDTDLDYRWIGAYNNAEELLPTLQRYLQMEETGKDAL